MAEQQERNDVNNRRDNVDSRDNRYNRYNRNYDRNNSDNQFNNTNRNDRRDNKEENKEINSEPRNVSVDLRTNIEKSVSGIGDLDSKRNQIISDLGTVNNMLVEFYDSQLNMYGAQGLRDAQGRTYAASNYTTPEEKLAAIESIIYYNTDRTRDFSKAFSDVQTQIKEQREKLKKKAVKLLDDNKKLIDDNKKLISDAKLEIHNDKEKSKQFEIERLEEKNKADVALNNKKFAEKKVEDIKKEIEELRKRQEDISMEIKNAKEDDAHAQATGKKKNSPHVGYYNAKSKEIESLTREIQQKENFVTDFNNQIIQFKEEYTTATNNLKIIEKKKSDLDAMTANKERNLATLESKNSELKKKFNSTIEPLEKAFDETVKGMYKNDQRLNYDKDSTLNNDGKESEVVPEEKEKDEQIDKESKSQDDGNGASVISGLPKDVTEEELSKNFITNFTDSSTGAQRRQILNGPGFKNIIAAMDSAGRFDRRHLRVALQDMQRDMQENVPSRIDFINNMKNIVSDGSIDFDELYDSMFTEYDDGSIEFNNFSKIEREELGNMQKLLDKFLDLKTNGQLTVEQAQLFEDNFAQFAKIGSLLENDSATNSRFLRGFKRLFKGDMYNTRRKLLISLSKYSEARFDELNNQYSKHNDFITQLGGKVENTPKYVENRGNIERTGRGLSQEVEDGKMNYR